MRSSFFAHEYWMNSGKKQPLRILAQSKDVFLGKISPQCIPKRQAMAIFRRDVFPKGLRTGKTPLRGKISPRCMQNQLILARSASYVCLKPGKTQLGNTSHEYLARKGLFSCPELSNHA